MDLVLAVPELSKDWPDQSYSHHSQFLTIDARPAATRSCWVAGLDHEILREQSLSQLRGG